VEAIDDETVFAQALAELRHWGADRFSIESLAGSIGADPAVIRRRWPDEQHLIVDALSRFGTEHVVIPDTGSLRDDLGQFATAVAGLLNSENGRGLVRALVIAGKPWQTTDVRSTFWRQRITLLSAITERAADRGELRAGVQPQAAIHLLVAQLYARALFSDEPVDDEFCSVTADLVWHAVRAQEPSS